MTTKSTVHKAGELEAIRGIAACAVICYHFSLAFGEPARLRGLWAFLYNMVFSGPPAVVIFFVLSGVVLPLSFFRSGGDANVVAVGATNRFLRLAFLIFLTTMGAYSIFALGLNYAKAAAEISGSSWLMQVGYPNPTEHFQPDFATALHQSIFGTLLENRSDFNVSLWTMHHELYGSFVSFGLALLFFRAPMRVVWIIALLAVVALQFTAWRLIPFVVGTALSAFLFRNPGLTLRPVFSISIIVVGAILYRYHVKNADHWPTAYWPWGSEDQKAWLIHTVAGSCLILGVVTNESVRRAMNARWLVAIGRHSFAMYAAHMLLVSSLASFVFIHATPMGKVPALVITTIIFAVALATVSYVLTRLDERGTKSAQSFVRRALGFKRDRSRIAPVPQAHEAVKYST